MLLLPLGSASAQTNDSKEAPLLQVGFAQVDITPVRPTPMAGYYGKRLSTETHDPLWAKATVMDDGKTSIAMISIDLIATTHWLTDETRRIIKTQSGIEPERVLITATHSHTGPVLYDPNSSRYNRFGNDADESKQYMLELPNKLAESVAKTVAAKQPVTVRHAIGEESKLAFNRRFFMSDGTVGWNPGKLNPRIVREAGPIDDRLPMVAFYNQQRQLAGLLSNFSIHLDTVGGTQWSADMPFALEQALGRVFVPACHLQYSTGCCGDVNHIDVRHAFEQKGHAEAARIGTRLAGAVLRSWNSLEPTTSIRLHATKQIVKLPLAKHATDRIEWAKSISERANSDKPAPFMEMVEAFRILDVDAKNGEPIEAEVQVISLGKDIAWVSMPGEIFVQLGLAIKDGSPFVTTTVCELANGSIGYVPTRQAYAQGNYEVVSARCAEGSGEMLVDSALQQLRKHYEIQSAK
jgi:neutral ceramidase